MKKLIHIFILFVALSSLIFVPVTKVNASKKVTLTYHSGKGYFKSSLNRGKSKISIRNKSNKKRGYAPAIRRDGYAFVGWYTKKIVVQSILPKK